MVEKKLLGDKTKGGFYTQGQGRRDRDARSEDARVPRRAAATRRSSATCKELGKIEDAASACASSSPTPARPGSFAWKVLSRSLAYSARRIGEIADNIVAIDDAMRWGYNWELGPFETWDALGFEAAVDRMKKDGVALPASIEKMRAAGAKSFYRRRRGLRPPQGRVQTRSPPTRGPRRSRRSARAAAPVLKNDGAEAWDLGDGVLGLTFKTKANSIDPDVIAMLEKAVEKAETDFRALVVANQGEHFCVGANLFLVVMAARQKEWEQIRTMVQGFQDATASG